MNTDESLMKVILIIKLGRNQVINDKVRVYTKEVGWTDRQMNGQVKINRTPIIIQEIS